MAFEFKSRANAQLPTPPELKEAADNAAQEVEKEKNELTATERWNQLNEVTRRNYQEFLETHQEHELEVQTLESQLSRITKLFNSRLQEAKRKKAEAKAKLSHPMYREAARLHERMLAEQQAPEERVDRVREMMDRRDQLKRELTEINSSWMRRLLRTGREKARELQELENKLKHPMYRAQKEEAPKKHTGYDYKQNYLRLVREKMATDDEAEQQRIEDQITNIKKEMAIRGMEDPEMAFAPKQEVKTYTIPEEALEPAQEKAMEAVEEVKEDKNVKKVIDLTVKLDNLRLTEEIAPMLDQFYSQIKNNETTKALNLSFKIREEILKSKNLDAYQLYNDWRNALKELTDLSKPEAEEMEVVEVKETGMPIVSIESQGKAYEARGKVSKAEEYEGYEVQMHGEDASVYNEATGTGVVIDGISSGQRETTLKMAKQAAVDLMRILETNPDDFTVEKMLANLNIDGFGGVMVMGSRYLPETDELVLVDIGNCQAYLGSDNIKINEVLKKGRREPVSIVKGRTGSVKLDDRREAGQQVYIRRIKLSDHRPDPTQPITLLMGSDGYQESTGQPLIDSLGKNINEVTAKDDITVLRVEIPPREKKMAATA